MKRKVLTYIFIFFSLVIMGLLFSSFNNVLNADEKITLKICGYNVSFEDSVKIEYALKTTGIEDYENIVMRTYESIDDYYDDNGYTLTYLENREIGGKEYSIFIDSHIAAKQMSTDFYTYASYETSDGDIYGSDVVKYSILQYVKNMMGSSKSNEELDDVLESMLEYGARTQKYFNYKENRLANDTYYEIKLEGGFLIDSTNHGLFKADEEVTFISPSEDFVYWINKDTSKIYSYYNEVTIKLNSDLNLKAVTELQASEGLEFNLINEGREYEVKGIGECEDEEITIPVYYNGKKVTKIGDNAFKDCTEIKSIIIQNSVKVIGDNAFNNCASLEYINISKNIKNISASAFTDCVNLVTVIMPINYDITEVDYFETCKSLENIFFFGAVTGIIPNLLIEKYRVFLYSDEYTDAMIIDGNFYWHYVDYKPEIWDKKSDGLLFFTNEDGSYRVSKMKFTDEVLYIPSFYNGKPVKEVENSSFYGNENIKTVYFGKNIEKIGKSAFAECSNLTNIYMSNSVKILDSLCFKGCTKLVKLNLANSITTLCDNTFYSCKGLIYIEIPNGVTSIGESCFYDCTALETIVLPKSIESIGDRAFSNCNNIKKIYYKGDYNRYKNIALVRDIDKFTKQNVYFYNDDWNYEPGNYWHYDEDGKIEILEDDRLNIIKNEENNNIECSGKNDDYTGTIVIPAIIDGKNVKGIAKHSFVSDASINELYILEGIEYIKEYSFVSCSSLQNVFLPKSLKEIGEDTFVGCPELVNVYYNGTKDEFGEIEIHEKSGINNINIYYYSETYPSDTLNTYWHYVNGKAIIWEVPNAKIEYSLINGEAEYEAIIYVGNEEKNIFVASKVNDKNVTSIGNEIFKDNTDIEYVYLPETIEVIDEGAFSCCGSLEFLEMFDSITKIGKDAFSNCISLENIRLSSALEEIGAYAFFGCSKIKDIILPLSVKTIGEFAFDNMRNLENVYYLGTEEDFSKIVIGDNDEDFISKVKYYQPEYKEEYLDSIYWHYMDGTPTMWETTIGLTFTKDTNGKYQLYSLGTSFDSVIVVPSTYNDTSVTNIHTFAFEFDESIEYVYIPDTVITMGDSVFYGCDNLKKVVLSNNLTEIPYEAFSKCENLKSIILPISVTKFKEGAFKLSDNLEKIYYMGSSTDFSNIKGSDTEIGSIKIYYYSEEEPTTEGNYFHIVDGEAKEW